MSMNKNLLAEERAKYFHAVSSLIPRTGANIVVLTHILPDRLELIRAIGQVADIVKIIGIPYSIDQDMLEMLRKYYPVVTPTMQELSDKVFLLDLIADIEQEKDLIIMEIGGYFSLIINEIKRALGDSFLGIIESTEGGHRRYEAITLPPCPIVSIARGALKFTEYGLIGRSCVFSADKIARETGVLLDGKKVLVLGYGRIGMGVAQSLKGRDCIVHVYDSNPIRRALAVSNGLRTGEKSALLANADFVFGATGNYSIENENFFQLKKGAMLISCSSRDIEFDLNFLNETYSSQPISNHLEKYTAGNHFFYMAEKGFPVNFIDNAIVGPILALIQAEILLATKTLKMLRGIPGLHEVSEKDRWDLAERWLDCFSD